MVKDFIADSSGNLLIKDGDYVVDYSDEQHIEDLVRYKEGEIKQFPKTGIGIIDFVNAPLTRSVKTKLEKKVRVNLVADEFEINQVAVESFDNIIIDAEKNE
jgi:hypothetical protein